MDKNMLQFYKAALSGELSTPLCSSYKAAWRKCGDNKEMLMRLSLSQQSLPYVAAHAYKGMGLTKEYIKKEFKDYINGYVFNDCDEVDGYTYALYVDWDYENDLDINTDVASIMWTVGANIIVPQTKAPTIYISNRSNVHLVGDGYNSINIKLFDKSKVTIEDLDENSEVVVYKYSDDAQVELGKYCLGKVKVFDKELKL
jgi:hypothetical protein